jgi:fructose-bisphosphate aldolase, class I
MKRLVGGIIEPFLYQLGDSCRLIMGSYFGLVPKRFAAIQLEPTEESRRAYRELLFTTTNINHFISGVILFEETLGQATKARQPFPELLNNLGIVPGIKVDKGLVPLPGTDNETITEGLDGLSQRLADYKNMGARFAKWRAVFTITDQNPSRLAIIFFQAGRALQQPQRI